MMRVLSVLGFHDFLFLDSHSTLSVQYSALSVYCYTSSLINLIRVSSLPPFSVYVTISLSCSGFLSRLWVPCPVIPLSQSEPAALSQDPSVCFTGTRSWLHFDLRLTLGLWFETQTETFNAETYTDLRLKERGSVERKRKFSPSLSSSLSSSICCIP